MPRPSNSAERRSQIVRALVQVMAERGYERATVVEVARAAGLTPGLVHYHFKSKDQILLALVEHVADRLRARVNRRVRAAGGPRDRLGSLLDAFAATGDDAEPEAVAAWVLVGGEAMKRPEVATLWQATLADAASALEAAMRAVLVDEGGDVARARPAALSLLCALQGAYQVAAGAPALLPPGFLATSLRLMADGFVKGEVTR